ncbi:MAG: winged helix-turn-helix domain-containing protein [Ketobacter sp.]|nr:winged helix-turn-helix domain-containing protein [Ketobacter sp.]
MRAYIAMPDLFRKIVITDNQIAIVRRVQTHDYPTITSRELAQLEGISVQSATIRLRRLWEIGYLTREERIASTGGIIFHYGAAV